jgi:hypothetical protein
MTDIVERLRNAETSVRLSDGSVDLVCHVAADEIERLREALRYYAKNHYPNVDDGPWGPGSNDFGDVARAALGEDK